MRATVYELFTRVANSNEIHEESSLKRNLNSFLDELPRPRLNCGGREVPTFRTAVSRATNRSNRRVRGGLLVDCSLVVLAALALTSAVSFYAYTFLRMWLTGRETLVLLEHVWFALACNALVLRRLLTFTVYECFGLENMSLMTERKGANRKPQVPSRKWAFFAPRDSII